MEQKCCLIQQLRAPLNPVQTRPQPRSRPGVPAPELTPVLTSLLVQSGAMSLLEEIICSWPNIIVAAAAILVDLVLS